MTHRRWDSRGELSGNARRLHEFRKQRALERAENPKAPKRKKPSPLALAPETACDGKVPHTDSASAEREAHRLTDVLGAIYEAYLCLGCGAWHTGRARGQRRDKGIAG